MGTAATPQVVDQRQSARSYGLGGKAPDLPASRGASGRHSAAGVDTDRARSQSPCPFPCLALPRFVPPLVVGPLPAAGSQLRVAASASSWAWVRVAAALPNHSPSSRWRAASIGSLDLPASWLRCSVTDW